MASLPGILVIGAGELGLQVLRCLAAHPRHTPGTVAVLLRPASINSSYPAKQTEIETLRGLGFDLVPGDIVEDSGESLASVFAHYGTVIGCTGFVSGQGIQLKVARAVLAANVSRFVPWQFGVDYDAIGRGSPQDLFDEQLDVRDLLRSQRQTRWAIISTGMFTSFLFEPSFGVVDLENAIVCALGSLENQVTVTTPEDIGRITAEIVLGEESDALFADRPIFVGGDTVSYEDVARIVESLVQKPVKRNVITVEDALAALAKDPDNGLLKYQAVFGQGRGVAWDMDKTWNRQRGMSITTAKEWATANLLSMIS
ncbi:uncharacterized protein N7496_000040 [Penicillium cataractarum]|uniref:NmrA-like domain-containing protein n=1 Tax=Penicillium cataractarum TaxID=2100454 RepID=A0A9X0B5P9_9EURO|nr:uncharacterized protein N7496_000040 [Penicillium cataractarum]KAJ5388972.1 hypothetical protein N7496_000040 [Penicillium cataractarum]